MLASRRLRAYLYAAFRRIGGISEKSLGTALEDEFPAGYPPLLREKRAKRKNARDIRDHGYYPAANALWMTRSYLTRKTRNDKTFDDGNKRDVRLREIIRSELDAWLSGHIDLTADLQPVDRAWFSSARVLPEGLPHLGVPIVGYRDGIIWLAATRDRAILHESDPARRAVLLQRLIEPFPVTDEYPWVSLVPAQWSVSALAAAPQTFATLARRVVRGLFDVSDTGDRGEVEILGKQTFGARTGTFGLLTLGVGPGELELLLARTLRSAHDQLAAIDWLIVASPVARETTTAVLQQVALDEHLNVRMLVADPALLTAAMGPFPWLWATAVQPATLTVLRGGTGEREVLADDPRVPSAVRAQENVVITGGPGTGKTSVVRKLVRVSPLELALLKNGLEIVVHARDGSAPAALVEQIVSDFLHRQWRVVVGVDDADHLHDTALVAALARMQREAPLLRLVISTRERHDVTDHVTRNDRPFHSIVLNRPSRFFLLDVATITAERHHVRADRMELFRLVEYLVMHDAGTPQQVATAVAQAARRPFVAPRGRREVDDPVAMVARWRRGESEDRVRYRLLQAVAVLADLGIPRLPQLVVLACVRAVTHESLDILLEAWNDIVERHAVLVHDEQVMTDSLPLPCFGFGLWEKTDAFPWRLRVWLLRNSEEVLSPRGRWVFLFFLWSRYVYCASARQADRVYRRFTSLFPYDLSIDIQIAILAQDKGEPPPAHVLERAAARASKLPEILLQYYFGQRDHAALEQILRAWIRQRPDWFDEIFQLAFDHECVELLPAVVQECRAHHDLKPEMALTIFQAVLTIAAVLANSASATALLRTVKDPQNVAIENALQLFTRRWSDATFQELLAKLSPLADAASFRIWETAEGNLVQRFIAELELVLGENVTT